MGHPIFKHMSSGQSYDNKQAYNKDLSDSARLHYLENEEHDKGMSRKASPLNDKPPGDSHPHNAKGEHKRGVSRKSSPASMDASYGDAPTEFNKGLIEAQRQGKLSGEFNTLVKNSSVSRKSSPVNNVSYGTGYIGEQKADLMKYNAVDDKAGMSRYTTDEGMSRKASPLNTEGHEGKEGHMHATIVKKMSKKITKKRKT